MESSSLGIETWGGGNRKQKRKSSKLSIITRIGKLTQSKSLDITALSIADLEDILNKAETEQKISVLVPTSRLKRPYIQLLTELFPKVALDKLPVSALKELLHAFNRKVP